MTNQSYKSDLEFAMNRPITGAMFGVAVVILTIFGLVHVFPEPLAGIATIVFGVALLYKGSVISTEYSKLLAHLSDTGLGKFELGGGVTAEITMGIAGIVLGILAILHFVPDTLIAVAVITFGAGSIIGSGVISRLNALKIEGLSTVNPTHLRHLHSMVSGAVGAQILAGIAAVILGILSLLGYAPLTLNLVALLVLGADSILSGSVLSEKLIGNIKGS